MNTNPQQQQQNSTSDSYRSSWWQTSYNHHFGGPAESYRRDNHPLLPKDDYTTLIHLRDESLKNSREVWRPEEVNKWGRVKDKHPLPLYQYAIGPACRAVHLTATLLKINLNLLEVRPEINSYKDVRFHDNFDPYRATPQLNSSDSAANQNFPVEHRAIMKYLCKNFSNATSYGGNRGISLYPDGWDDRRRYKIDVLLDMDARQIYPAITGFIEQVIDQKLVGNRQITVPQNIVEEMRNLDRNLSMQPFLADDALSLADLAVFVTIAQLELINFEFRSFPYLNAWIERIKSLEDFQQFNKPFIDYKSYLSGLEKL